MRWLIPLSLLFNLVTAGRAQPGNDSMAMKRVHAAFLLISTNPDSALKLSQAILEEAQGSGDQRLAASAYSTRGWAWLHKGSYEKTFSDLGEAARIFRSIHDTSGEMNVCINLGLAYSQHSEFAKSAQYLLVADSLAQLVNNERTKAEVKREMGILYREQGIYPKAIVNFRESMERFRLLRDTVHFFGAVSSLCAVYLAMSQPDSSLVLLQGCLPYAAALHGYEKGMLLEHFGDTYFSLSRYNKAMEAYDAAYQLFGTNHNQADMAYEAMNLGKTFAQLKNYKEAETYLLLSYRINDSLHLPNYAHDAAEQLAELFKTMGDWRNAYHWLAVRDVLHDSLDLTTVKEKTAQLQAKYEADKKEEEISLLKKDQELNRAIAQRNKAFQRGAVFVEVLLVLIGLLIINRYRSIDRVRRLIDLEKMRNQIARDLHDDMGSALSSIHIISKVPAQGGMGEHKVPVSGGAEEQKFSARLLKIHEHSGLMLENMSDIVWTINPANDTLERIVFKMREFAADILDPLNIGCVVHQEGEFHAVRLGLQTRRDIYLIFKEAINNAAKYSGCSKVGVTIAAAGGGVRVEVRDDGKGFRRSEIRFGNGLRNMEERARQIGGELKVESEPGCGTAVILRVRSHD